MKRRKAAKRNTIPKAINHSGTILEKTLLAKYGVRDPQDRLLPKLVRQWATFRKDGMTPEQLGEIIDGQEKLNPTPFVITDESRPRLSLLFDVALRFGRALLAGDPAPFEQAARLLRDPRAQHDTDSLRLAILEAAGFIERIGESFAILHGPDWRSPLALRQIADIMGMDHKCEVSPLSRICRDMGLKYTSTHSK